MFASDEHHIDNDDFDSSKTELINEHDYNSLPGLTLYYEGVT